MRKYLITIRVLIILVSLAVFAGFVNKKPTADHDQFNQDEVQHNEYKSIVPVGQVPDAFLRIVENNVFYGATALDDRLLKSKIVDTNAEDRTVSYQIQMMDSYGNDLAAYTCNCNDAYHVKTLTATRDGGFLFVLGFSDRAYDQDTWASDYGFASRIIKCDKEGALQFDTPLDGVEGRALQYCFEKNGNFYFFGTMGTPQTKMKGVVSPSDIYMLVLDGSGAAVNSQYIAGSDYDSLDAAEISADSFVLSINAQSDDGDFTGSKSDGYPKDWVFTVNEDLEITGKEMKSGRDYFDNRLGVKDGETIYSSDALLKDFDAGTPEILVDYGDFYLIVSTNITGIYENTPLMISSIWYYTESVYSAYDHNGNLIFRASVDSSRDYDALAQKFQAVP